MTIDQALKQGGDKLKKSSSTPWLDAEVLISYVIKKPKEFLLAHSDKKLTPKQQTLFQKLVRKRERFWPVAYLVGKKEFYGLDFYVDPHVMIPRPETEFLVEEVIRFAPKNKKIIIADIGTGCGNITVTLAKFLPKAHFIATDISKAILNIAKKNAKAHSVAKRIKFQKGSLDKPLKKKVDVLVANLPYLSEDEYRSAPPILKREPKKALVAKNKGLHYYQKLIPRLYLVVKKSGHVFLEFPAIKISLIQPEINKLIKQKKLKTIEIAQDFLRLII